MARLEWIMLCDRAVIDRQERVSLFGVPTHFPVPLLPLAIDTITIVAKLIDARPGDEMAVGIAISTPCGKWIHPTSAGFDVEGAGEYLFVTLYEVPLTEPGTYRFALGLGDEELGVDIPVTLIPTPGAEEGARLSASSGRDLDRLP